jgi:hypothetical protein
MPDQDGIMVESMNTWDTTIVIAENSTITATNGNIISGIIITNRITII